MFETPFLRCNTEESQWKSVSGAQRWDGQCFCDPEAYTWGRQHLDRWKVPWYVAVGMFGKVSTV